MKLIFALLGTLVVASCTTTPSEQSYRTEILGLTDMSQEYILDRWGEPDLKVPKSNGSILSYKNVLTKDVDPLSEITTKKICTLDLTVVSDVVKTWDYKDCLPVEAP